MKKLILIAALSLALVGCGTLDPNARSVLQGGPSITAKVEQPVSRNSMASIELTYNGMVAGLNAYYSRPICPPGVQASWNNPCSEPAIRRELAKYRRTARDAILKVRIFRRDNPTVSVVSLVRAAGDAVADLKAIATINGVKITP